MPLLKKVHQVGNSLAVFLPAEWCKYYGLKHGDEILMEVNNEIIIKVKENRENERREKNE